MNIKVVTTCPECDKSTVHTVDFEAFQKLQAGAKVQDAFPMMPPEEREQLVSGYCPSCWKEMFSEHEEWGVIG